MAALALAGYSTHAEALWHETWRELKDSVKEPYLRAMFSFLTCKKDFLSVVVSLLVSTMHEVGASHLAVA